MQATAAGDMFETFRHPHNKASKMQSFYFTLINFATMEKFSRASKTQKTWSTKMFTRANLRRNFRRRREIMRTIIQITHKDLTLMLNESHGGWTWDGNKNVFVISTKSFVKTKAKN